MFMFGFKMYDHGVGANSGSSDMENGKSIEDMPTGRQLSYGEKSVGLSFNPSGNNQVNECKSIMANAIDQMNNLRNNSDSSEQKRLCSIAITEMQSAQMFAVKAITWVD